MEFLKYISSYFTSALFIINTVTAIQDWRGTGAVRWATNCNFEGNDLRSVTSIGEQCGGLCKEEVNCTHFTWTTFKDGTCWMKSGRIFPEKAIHSDSPGSVCGFLVITWVEEIELSWAHNCTFHGNDLKELRSTGHQCGIHCQTNSPCSHFDWKSIEGQSGMCLLKSDRTSKENAILNKGLRENICGILRNEITTVRPTLPADTWSNISWLEEIDLSWAHYCTFHGNDLKELSSTGNLCGNLCKQNSLCSHFVWTNIEGQSGMCSLKSDETSKEKAILNKSLTGTICGILKREAKIVQPTLPDTLSKNEECECVC